jgi:hypothetical protein
MEGFSATKIKLMSDKLYCTLVIPGVIDNATAGTDPSSLKLAWTVFPSCGLSEA